MSHRGIIGTGLIVLALWFQALAPVVALRAIGIAPDPLTVAVICSPSIDKAGLADPAEQAHHAGCSLCALCTAGLAAATLPAAPLATMPAGLWRVVCWPIPPPSSVSTPEHRPGQPRAPPVSV